MITFIHKFTLCLTACLLACVTGHAYEQDNWYLAWEKSISSSFGVAYYEDNSTGIGQIYLLNGSNTGGKISVYDLNGSLDRHINIANNRYSPRDLCLDAEGNIYIAENNAVTSIENDGTFKWRTGKDATAYNYGSWSGTGNGEFNNAYGITQGPDGNLYVADNANYRIQVLDKNGTFIKKFGEYGSAPGQLSGPLDLIFLPDGRLIVGEHSYLNYFDSNGTFISRTNSSSAREYVSLAPDGTIFCRYCLRDADGEAITYLYSVFHASRTAFTSEGDLIESGGSKLRLWKRAYRTKGLPERNVIPQPAIRGVTQRAGTNVLDVDFEIVDSDDTNAIIGIIAYCGNDKVVPQTWVDGTGSKINTSITTNEVHRVSWDVKQDWNTSTGTIKFEILCQDGRTNKPVDIHFLTLPFSDGNMTISRSPLQDSDFKNYAKYLLAKGDAQFESESSNAVTYGGNQILTTSWGVTTDCRTALLNALGSGVGGWKGSGLDTNSDGIIQGAEWTASGYDTGAGGGTANDGVVDAGEVAAAIAADPSLDVDGDGTISAGFSYRWATTAEVTKAREAATPGAVNNWTASVQVQPRNLPGKVNEYGFDVSTTSGYWVIKE
jgi:hypothetical protein